MADSDAGVYGFALKYGSTYSEWFFAMATSPAAVVDRTRKIVAANKQFQFFLIIEATSAAIGATIGSVIPGRPPLATRAVIFLTVALLWVFLSLLVQFFCRLLGGKESSGTSLFLMMQDLAFVYVVSNFLTLIIVSLPRTYKPIADLLSHQAFYKQGGPGVILFGLQFLLLLYLVPLTVSQAHGFTGVRWLITAIFAAAFALFFGLPVFLLGGC